MVSPAAIPQRPYLLRAMHAWITDSGHTPHMVVDAAVEGVSVPSQYVQDGKVVLNLSHNAVNALDIGNDRVTFQARFAGAAYAVAVPVRAVLGIYARETGRGMIFQEEDGGAPAPQTPPAAPAGEGGSARRPNLKVVR
ncbi:MAG: ClpXP protease specificity-enhancing factor [Gammaproteobacteria bacterium]|nr:ClpXP protease specificity-enhancing factor [Gammaproteobacteria bacterium]